MTRLLPILLLSAVTASAATYYIDFATGNDANNGTSKATPWKTHPAMTGSGVAGYVHSAGDHFIFKGGVTWPLSGLWWIKVGGADGNPDYYGVDKTWFTGGSFSRPILDGQNALSGFIYLGTAGFTAVNNITIDNFDMRNLYWDHTVGNSFGAVFFIKGEQVARNLIQQNCWFHHWTHESFAAGTSDTLICITRWNETPLDFGSYVTNCVFDSEQVGISDLNASGAGVKYYQGGVYGCTFTNMVSDILLGQGNSSTVVANNYLARVYLSFDPNAHDNILETLGGGTHYIYNNFCEASSDVNWYISTQIGDDNWVWNNVIQGNATHTPIMLSTEKNPVGAHIFENTIIATGGAAIYIDNKGTTFDTLDVRNNFLIGATSLLDIAPGVTVTSQTTNNNVAVTAAAATAQGYTLANRYAPTAIGNSSVGAGVDLSAISGGILTTDIVAVARPQPVGRWDVGAYEFVASSPPTFTLTVNSGSGGGPYTAGTVVPIAANAPPAGSQFATWVGATVANPTSASTTLTMPAANTSVTATYSVIPPTIKFQSATYPTSLTAGTVTLTVQRLYPSNLVSTVHYATANGSAVAGTDYTATSGTLTFGVNATSGTISVPIINTGAIGPARVFTVTLSSPTNGTLGTSTAQVSIAQNGVVTITATFRGGMTISGSLTNTSK